MHRLHTLLSASVFALFLLANVGNVYAQSTGTAIAIPLGHMQNSNANNEPVVVNTAPASGAAPLQEAAPDAAMSTSGAAGSAPGYLGDNTNKGNGFSGSPASSE